MHPPEPEVVLPSEREIESTMMLLAAITPAAKFEAQLLFSESSPSAARLRRNWTDVLIVLKVVLLQPKLAMNPKVTTVPFVFHINNRHNHSSTLFNFSETSWRH